MYMSERQQTNLVRPQQNIIFKQVKDTLQHEAIDIDKFQELYLELREQPLIQQQSQNLSLKTGPFTSTQLFILKSQVLAYKHLTRNQSIPAGILANALQPSLWFSERQKLTTKATSFYKDKIERQLELRNMILGKFQPKRDQFFQQNYERERMLEIIDSRSKQLEEMLENSDNLTEEAQMRLQIELKFLSLRDLFFTSRQKVTNSLIKNNYGRILETQLLDRSAFRPQRPARNRDTGNRTDNKLENQMKNDYQRRKRMKHKQFIQQLYIHHGKFFQFHKKNTKTLKKRVTQVKTFYQNLQNKKKQNQAKEQGIGLQMLRKQQMGKYIEYIQETKNKKISDLLNQTNNFLKQLGAKVLLQKGENPNPTEDAEMENKQEDLTKNFANANKTYYNLTHSISQQITIQPTILKSGELKHYQLIGLQWLVSLYNNNLNGILADEMGLGKTIQTISLFAYLIQFKKNNGPFLIIVPLSTISNWVNQFDKWAPSIKKIVYKGSQQARNEIAKILKTTKWNVCITTYEFILRDRKNLYKYTWQYIVIDEGHRMKNTKSKFAETLTQDYHSNHRLLLTGTPLQNNLGELWALLNFLLPKVFSDSEDFEKWFAMPVTKNSPESQHSSLTEQEKLLIINRLHQVLRPFLLRRIKKEVESQLPDKIEHVVKVQLSSWQRVLYSTISSKGAGDLAMGSNKITTKAVMNLMMQLRKCCNHPYLFLNNIDEIADPDYVFRSSGKFELLDRMLPKLLEFKHRILIFSQMTHLMNILQIYFDLKGYRHLRLDGNTKAEDREQITKDFNAENSPYDILLLSTRAGGLGLNLQTADTVIIFDSDWNPQMDKQAEDRAHRIGQKKQVLVLRFITNTPIEELILEKAAYKMDLDELFIQGGLYNLKSSEAERKQKIEGLLKKKDQQDQGEDQIPNDDTINMFLKRSEEEYEYFTKMDEQRYQRESKMYPHFVDPREGKDLCFNYRLLGDDEIPDWLVETHKPAQQEVKQLGKGGRIRKKVNYNDDISDEQFMKMMEEEYEIAHQPKEKDGKDKKNQLQPPTVSSEYKSNVEVE